MDFLDKLQNVPSMEKLVIHQNPEGRQNNIAASHLNHLPGSATKNMID